MSKQIGVMISQLGEWLKSLESSGHTGDHDDCPNCKRYWAILKAWAAMDDLQELVKVQDDDDEVQP